MKSSIEIKLSAYSFYIIFFRIRCPCILKVRDSTSDILINDQSNIDKYSDDTIDCLFYWLFQISIT